MIDRNTIQPLPKCINKRALFFARLAMATMSTQTFEVFPDGALCDRQLYDLFVKYGTEPQSGLSRGDAHPLPQEGPNMAIDHDAVGKIASKVKMPRYMRDTNDAREALVRFAEEYARTQYVPDGRYICRYPMPTRSVR